MNFIKDLSETINSMKSGLYILGWLAGIHTATFICYFAYKYCVDETEKNKKQEQKQKEVDEEVQQQQQQVEEELEQVEKENLEEKDILQMEDVEHILDTTTSIPTQTLKDDLYYLLVDKRQELDKLIIQLDNIQNNNELSPNSPKENLNKGQMETIKTEDPIEIKNMSV
jgi:flagellar biosynthesis component FlhA